MILLSFFVVVLTIFSSWQTEATSMDSSPGLYFVPRPDPADANDTLIHYKARDEASVRKWTSKIDDFLKSLYCVPRPDPADANDTLIQYKASDEASVRKWTSKIDDFLKEYSLKAPGGINRMACSWDHPTSAREKPCDVPVNDFYPCTSVNNYNYPRAPCVFLALDKLLHWTPNPYNTTEDLPTDMPEDLKQSINQVSGRRWANAVWVSCEGESPAHVEAMGPIQYIPRLGFPSYYFPFNNQEGYLSPLVAVLFEKPKTGVVIKIECKAWAKNISQGSVHFKLMVDA